MKYAWIAILSMMLNPSSVLASGIEVGFGGLTPHYGVGAGYHNYCEQIEKSDVIYNRTYYARIEGDRDALTYMIGYDSICSPIQGAFYTLKLYEGDYFMFGITGGGYRFNMSNWIYEENNPGPGKLAVYPIYSKLGPDFYFVPVLGAELDIAFLYLSDDFSLWLNSLITPIIGNVSISLKWKF